MCRFSVPPGYVRTKSPGKSKLGPLIPVIDAILAADITAPPKQRHTAKRIFERLKAEHGFGGGYTVVKDYVRHAQHRLAKVPILQAARRDRCRLRRGTREALSRLGSTLRRSAASCRGGCRARAGPEPVTSPLAADAERQLHERIERAKLDAASFSLIWENLGNRRLPSEIFIEVAGVALKRASNEVIWDATEGKNVAIKDIEFLYRHGLN